MVAGLLLINKPKDKSSFHLVCVLRALTRVSKIGHAGTLDPMATGLMVMLIGKEYTKLSDRFLSHNKRYLATIELGKQTSTDDITGDLILTSPLIPSTEALISAIAQFQGETLQTPPMFSAKKKNGTPLYKLARQGQEIERTPSKVWMEITLLNYSYPYVQLEVHCSKGCYIRSLAKDLGYALGSFATLASLIRTASGPFHLDHALAFEHIGQLRNRDTLLSHLITSIPFDRPETINPLNSPRLPDWQPFASSQVTTHV